MDTGNFQFDPYKARSHHRQNTKNHLSDNPFYWAANNEGIDPESFNANGGKRTDFMMPTYSVGLSINF